MGLSEDERKALVNLEIEKSQRMIDQLQLAIANKMWDLCANRLYYAVFHAVSALLISRNIQVGTHKGASIRFHQDFVAAGVFSPEAGHMYSRLQQLREEGDYNCYINTSESEVMQYVEPAKDLINQIISLIKK